MKNYYKRRVLLKAIILAGGSGTRLWPLSRSRYPKQFIKLKTMKYSLFQMTIDRCLSFCKLEDIYVMANKEYEFILRNQIVEMGYPADKIKVLLEPVAKNTLPAIYYAVREINDNGSDTAVVLPSDHLIDDNTTFANDIKRCESLTKEYIFTFGIRPNEPETGYGYIMPGEKMGNAFRVEEFKEKPNFETAKQYVEKGYLWNSGMFMFNTDVFIKQVDKHANDVRQAFEDANVEEAFEKAPSISIDYGLMEKSESIAVLPLDIIWDDLGSFSSLYETYNNKKDDNGNVVFDKQITIESNDNLIYINEEKICALVGVDNLVIVDDDDALLICNKGKTQEVKQVVDVLKEKKDQRADLHRTEFRPWGSFTILEFGEYYKIKRISVIPSKQLSYQMHFHRSEHWIVVSGTATITVDDENYLVRSGESIFIKAGSKHRMMNEGKISLEVIEVQSGLYLGEDDIVRFEDDFGRC